MEEGHYRCSAEIIKRSAGHSAVAASAYRAGERVKDERTERVHDYSRRKGVLHAEIMTPTGAPAWMQDRATLWNTVEQLERRKDAQVAREVVVSLPHQLDDAGRLALARSFVQTNFVSRGMVADLAIHAPPDDGDHRNYHAHILLSLRQAEPRGFRAVKTREWNSDEFLRGVRASWAQHVNAAYEQAGLAVQVDHRSYKDRGDKRQPTVHLGKTRATLARQGKPLPERPRKLSESSKAYVRALKIATPDKQRWMRHPRSPWAKARRRYQYERNAQAFHVDRTVRNWTALRNRAFLGNEQAQADLGKWHVLTNERQKAQRQLWGIRKRREELFHNVYKDGQEAMRRFSLLVAEVGQEKALKRLRAKPMQFGTPSKGAGFVLTGRWKGLEDLARAFLNIDREQDTAARANSLTEAVAKIRRRLDFQEWKVRTEQTRAIEYEARYVGQLVPWLENNRQPAYEQELARLRETKDRKEALATIRASRMQLEKRQAERLAQRPRELERKRENW